MMDNLSGIEVKSQICLCGVTFDYLNTRGCKRLYCNAACRNKFRAKRVKESLPFKPACKTAGCCGRASRVINGLCEPCFGRWRRNGTTDKTPIKQRYRQGQYCLLNLPNHPLARKDKRVFEHRKVAYDKYGSGIQQCFWCGYNLEWSEVAVDHLNDIKHDNRKENLVIACHRCNLKRASILPFIRNLRDEALLEFIKRVEATHHSLKTAKYDTQRNDDGMFCGG